MSKTAEILQAEAEQIVDRITIHGFKTANGKSNPRIVHVNKQFAEQCIAAALEKQSRPAGLIPEWSVWSYDDKTAIGKGEIHSLVLSSQPVDRGRSKEPQTVVIGSCHGPGSGKQWLAKLTLNGSCELGFFETVDAARAAVEKALGLIR